MKREQIQHSKASFKAQTAQPVNLTPILMLAVITAMLLIAALATATGGFTR